MRKNVFPLTVLGYFVQVFADDIDPVCGVTPDKPCQTGHWITPAVMSIYLLVSKC